MTLTGEQQRAVGAKGSVVVVAGAGTGKTHMLTERYVHHLSEDGLSPLEVVAVTFTEKAAEELRSRVRERVRGRLASREDHLAELEAAQISTIHALCARVCREHPDEAEVPADFGILDELRGRLWTADRLADAMDHLPEEYYRVVPYPLMQAALESLLSDPLAAEVALTKGPEGWRDLIEEARESAVAGYLEEAALKEARWTLELCEGDDEDRMEQSRRATLSALDDLEAGRERKGAFELLASIDLRGGKKKAWGEGELASVKEALKLVRELARAAMRRGIVVLEPGPADERLAGALPVLRDAFYQARAFLTEAKRRSRVMDFADLEVHALRALEHEEVQDYYRERWRAFLVDEFQDTNPVQAELLERLTQEATLTVVGDENQSIYGFRRADVEVFRRFRDRILSEGGEEVVLATSFRGHSELVGVLNAVFSSALGEMRQDLEAHRGEPPHEAPHVRLYAVESEGRVQKAQLQRAEAAHIARQLREMLDKGVEVYDAPTSSSRPVRPGDIAILSRVWAPLEIYGDALAASGILSVHAGGGNLLETREAKDGIVLLRFLADPTDDLALVAVLRSPFFALADRLLHDLAAEREKGTWWWQLVGESDDTRLEAAKEVLGDLLAKRRLEPPTALLQLVDRLTGYTAVIANLPGAQRREADWRGFKELVGDLERGSDDAFTVVRWLRQLHEAEAQVPRPPIEAGDAVSLMTIHAAKGLEWPVVVIPDLARAMPSYSGAVAFDPELGVSVDFGEEEGQPALHRLIRDKKARLEEDETRRVFYVAPTRARPPHSDLHRADRASVWPYDIATGPRDSKHTCVPGYLRPPGCSSSRVAQPSASGASRFAPGPRCVRGQGSDLTNECLRCRTYRKDRTLKATGTFFSNLLQGQQHFVVPLFQRPYTWEDEDWRTLFDDAIEVYEEGPEERHFVGSIVTKSLGATPEGVSPFLIIDGQQRLTTVTLLLAALRDVARETAPKLSDKIHRLYLTNEFAPDEHRYKVLPTQVDRSPYQTIVDGHAGAAGGSGGTDTPLPWQAYEYFLKRLRKDLIDGEPLDPIRLEQVLVGRLEVVSITLEDTDNEYRIFESLNGTGTPLAQADLIRNYFFMRLPPGEHEELYHGVWLPMQESLDAALDLFLRHAYMSSGQFVRESDVYRAWKARLDPVPAHELRDRMRDLAAKARNYHKLLAPAEEQDPLISRELSRLNRWGSQTSYPFLLNAYRLYQNGDVGAREFAEVLTIIESFLVRRLFARVHPGQLNRLFLRLYHQLPEGVGLAEGTKIVLSELSRRWPRDDDFGEAIRQLPFYTDGRPAQRRLILETIEESYGSKEPVDLSALTIEHVMPQTLTEEWVATLGEFAEERHREMVHRLGNLTLTGYNPELSNSPFHVKREKLAESNVAMNKEIAREEEWGFAQIEERGRRLAERALSIWLGPAPSRATFGTAPSATSAAGEIEKAGESRTISDDEVKHLMFSILPESGFREVCLGMFADAIAEANVHGRDKWAVTRTSGKVRLIVGHLVVCAIGGDRPGHGPVWMALDKGLLRTPKHHSHLERSHDWEWDAWNYPEYPTIQSRNGYYRPSHKHAETWPVIKQLHFESIRKAATETTMDARTPRGHSPEVLEHLRNELGRQIPDPHYWQHGHAIDLIYEHRPDRRTEMREVLEALVREQEHLVLDESDKYNIRFIPRDWDQDTLKVRRDWADKWTKTGRILLFEFSNRDTIRVKLIIGPGPEEVRQKLFEMALRSAAFRPSREVLQRKWNTIFSRKFLKLELDSYEERRDEILENLGEEWTKFLEQDLPRLDASLIQERWIWEAAEPQQ